MRKGITFPSRIGAVTCLESQPSSSSSSSPAACSPCRPPAAPLPTSSSARSTPAGATPAQASRTTSSSSSTAARPPIDVSGWTIQYASAGGTTWQATALTGSIAPGRRYLVQLASAGAVGAPLPTPDATGTTNLAVSGGKVAVVRDSTRAHLRRVRRELLGRHLGRRPGRLRRRRGLRGWRAGCRTRQHDRRGARRRWLHGHRRERHGLLGRRPDTAKLVERGGHVRRRAAARGRRLPGRGGGRRHPARPLDRARAPERQLREHDLGRHPGARYPSG